MCAPLSRLLLQEESLPPPPLLLILLVAGPAASLWLRRALNLLLRSHCRLLVLERPHSHLTPILTRALPFVFPDPSLRSSIHPGLSHPTGVMLWHFSDREMPTCPSCPGISQDLTPSWFWADPEAAAGSLPFPQLQSPLPTPTPQSQHLLQFPTKKPQTPSRSQHVDVSLQTYTPSQSKIRE